MFQKSDPTECGVTKELSMNIIPLCGIDVCVSEQPAVDSDGDEQKRVSAFAMQH